VKERETFAPVQCASERGKLTVALGCAYPLADLESFRVQAALFVAVVFLMLSCIFNVRRKSKSKNKQTGSPVMLI